MKFRALIFDFDGLILNTEVPEYKAWTEIFRRHNATLLLEDWVKVIGTTPDAFNVIDHLQAQVSGSLDIAEIHREKQSSFWSLMEQETVMPGIEKIMTQARSAGMRMAIASSSPFEWVDGHISRLGIKDQFDFICTSEDVAKVKPEPDLFLCAAKRLQVDPQDAVVFEDSLNGVIAAKKANMSCVAVPHILTRGLDLSSADLIINSLADYDLQEILFQLNGKM